MTQILGFAGKKQSGKNTACNYIIALKLAELGVSKKTRLSANGSIEITDIFGETRDEAEKKAIEYKKPFLFICPITIMETKKRSKMFADNKLSVINLNNRTNYIGEKGKKVFFHSIWVLNDGQSKIYYEEIFQ